MLPRTILYVITEKIAAAFVCFVVFVSQPAVCARDQAIRSPIIHMRVHQIISHLLYSVQSRTQLVTL